MRIYRLTDKDLPRELIPVREVFQPNKKDKAMGQLPFIPPEVSTPGHDSFLKAKERIRRSRELA
jgi:hypothetical protein